MYSVYLITNGNRTYVGSTTDVDRRLRQHNREIVGGARATARGSPNWTLHSYVFGFSSRSEACRWESIVKKRARGLRARQEALLSIIFRKCPRSPTGRPDYEVPANLWLVTIKHTEEV